MSLPMDPMAAIRDTFFQECEEGLADLEAGLLRMQAGEVDDDTVNAVFRAVHSIKGGAGAFSLEALVRFAHVMETTLDDVRAGRVAADAAVVGVLLRATDVLADLVAAARDGGEVDDAQVQGALGELAAASVSGDADLAGDDDGFGDFDFQPIQVLGTDEDDEGSDTGGDEEAQDGRLWTLRFTPTARLYAHANDPLLLFRELRRLGELEVELDAGALPPLTALEPEASYLSWTLRLRTEAGEASIREVFEFVEDDCALSLTCGAEAAAPGAWETEAWAEAIAGEHAMQEGAPAEDAADLAGVADVLALIARAKADVALQEPAPVVEHLPAPAPVARVVAADAAEAAPAERPQAAPAPTIRVDLQRVDRLIDLVGELVINQAMLSQRVGEAGLARGSAAVMALDELEHLTRDIQDSVMAIRAQPVKSVFQRMPRLVRETAALVGKQVRLVTEGEGTEVDKTVIERLAEPLTHMIRNSIDHGIEGPEGRAAAGKPAEGTVRLSALHRSGRIVIQVADDGAGINRPRVRQIAADKGLIAEDAQLSDEEIDNLIFMPGFSTAATVSDVSGRGVGMDVVRRAIQALGGRITISSRPGQGSTFTLSLPLTLAVLDGMVVTVSGQTLVAPLTAMVETLQPQAAAIHAFGDGALINIRNAYLPLIDVGHALGYRARPLAPGEGVALLVETEDGGRAALLVDAIQGQRQVVIKSLESNFRQVPGVAAATILGDGRVALILDVDAAVALGKAAAGARLDPPLALAS